MKPLIGTELKRFLRDYKRQYPLGRDLVGVLQSVEYPYNVGAMFRLADGVGMRELVLTGITPTPPNPTIDKVGRFKSLKVPWRFEQDSVTAVSDLREQGYRAVAIELAEGAVPYYGYDFPEKVCLVVGHEDHGVTKATLGVCDAAVFIPMYGKGRSLNVAMAFGVVANYVVGGRK
jgi:tRNA (guanosine-2'-O-)-methyltransferase